jgi:hyaluronan synthase
MTFQTQQKAHYSELDRKRWFVRYVLIAAVAVVLAVRVYLLLYVIDFTLGIYSFFSSFVLLNIIALSYIGYRDPYQKVKDSALPSKPPLVSIVVPVKNEEENIRRCVESCLKQTYKNKEILIVNDGSTDKTGEILEDLRKEWGPGELKVFHLSKSVGKKQAVEVASQVAKGDIYAFMDSDCDMAYDAVEKAVKIFEADRKLGALTGHVRVRNAHAGNLLEKLQDVYADGSCRALKGAENCFASVTCCSGALSFYKRASIQEFIHDWAHDRFLGEEFKFCTDRRMTAYVLGTKHSLERSTIETTGRNNQIRSGSEGYGGELSFQKSQSSGESHNSYWNVKYSQSVRVYVVVPAKLRDLLKQQIRWKKSFIRSLSSTGGMYWKRPFWPALLYYIQTVMKFVRPYILFHALFVLPFVGDLRSTGLWLLGVMFTGMIYAVDFRLRNPGDPLWLYRPIFTFLTAFVYTWLLPYAALTIKNKAWR